MSIKINNKLIAGKYKTDVVQPANEEKAGIIRIATEEEVLQQTDNNTAVTPAKLANKQDKLTAGENISIENNIVSATYTAGSGIDITNGVISNTQTSAEWGNIQGDISAQTDLQAELNKKVDKVEGKSLIADTEIERLSNVDNYDDTAVKDDIQSINTEIVDINNSLDNIEKELVLKQNLLVAGENVTLTPQGDNTKIDVSIPTVLTDDTTIVKNDNNVITAIGTKSKNDIVTYDWVGTSAQYTTDLASGLITNTTKCLITDDEIDLTNIIDVEVPTKLSELANDTNFINQSVLDNVNNNLQSSIALKADDTNVVHKTGNETIDGFKQFSEQISVANSSDSARFTHKNLTVSTADDAYIEVGPNKLIYGNKDRNNIYHTGNLVAGENIEIVEENGIYKINGQEGSSGPSTNVLVDNETILKNEEDVITTVGVKSKTGEILYDWKGTKKEYNTALENGVIQNNWICYITDDDNSYMYQNYGSDVALLDIIVSNHLLDGQEKVGKELQGSIVYKHTYKDAYIKLLNNKNKSTSVQVTEDIGGISVTYTQCANSWKIIDIANKSVYNELFSTTGSANFFVLDELNELFYLPKTNNIYQPTTDLSKANTYISAGLPNITGVVGMIARNNASGAFYGQSGVAGHTSEGGDSDCRVSFDASRSSAIYGNSNTVQPQANNVFIYYKVGNTINIQSGIDLGAKIDNFIADNNTSWDGQWIYPSRSSTYISWSTAGTKIIDLSEILPNDGYNYECLFGISFYATNQLNVYIGTDLVPVTTDAPGWVYNQGSGKGNTGTIILAVGSGRYVQVNASAAPTGGTYHFAVIGYHRLGTNI